MLTSVVCIAPKAAVPMPPSASSIHASAKKGRLAAAASSTRNMTVPLRKSWFGASLMRPEAMIHAPNSAPKGSAPASSPIMLGEAPKTRSPQAGKTVV